MSLGGLFKKTNNEKYLNHIFELIQKRKFKQLIIK